jgi:hypothetical protein
MSNRRSILLLIPVACAGLALACDRGPSSSAPSAASPMSPSSVAAATPAAAKSPALPDRLVTMQDACDPETFNATIGEGTCNRNGGVTFANFIDQLTKHGSIGAWHFSPPDTTAKLGQVFVAVNRGGEVHTFTEVDEFGGGIVGVLNQVTGNTKVAPECLALEGDDFVPPGGTYREEPLEHIGTARFQCCIHPWMRLEARVQ